MEHGDVSSTNADWMSQLPEELWGTPLWDLAIPGSHDSMSYCLDTHSPVLGSESVMLQFLDRLAPCIAWCIPDQLDAGIRFFDLRIAHKNIKNTHNTQDLLKTHNTDDTLYFAHAIYTLQTVKEALSTMAVWLKQHQKEVVILSCSHFYLLTDSEHQALVCYITQLFKDKLCPPQVQDRQDPTTACLSQGWGQFSFQKVVPFVFSESGASWGEFVFSESGVSWGEFVFSESGASWGEFVFSESGVSWGEFVFSESGASWGEFVFSESGVSWGEFVFSGSGASWGEFVFSESGVSWGEFVFSGSGASWGEFTFSGSGASWGEFVFSGSGVSWGEFMFSGSGVSWSQISFQEVKCTLFSVFYWQER
ncbi:uncharacterized protein ACWYII_032877 isoform 2-T2 [Salvelinus alpinus]